MASDEGEPHGGNLGPWEPWHRVRQEATRGVAEVAPDAPKGDLAAPPHHPPRWSFADVLVLLVIVAPIALAVGAVVALGVFVGLWAVSGFVGLVLAAAAVWVRTHENLTPKEVARMQREAADEGLPPLSDDAQRSDWILLVRLAAATLLVAALALLTYAFAKMPL